MWYWRELKHSFDMIGERKLGICLFDGERTEIAFNIFEAFYKPLENYFNVDLLGVLTNSINNN